MSDGLKTKLKGVVFPLEWIKKIEEYVAPDPLRNFQDYVRKAVQKRMEFDKLLLDKLLKKKT